MISLHKWKIYLITQDYNTDYDTFSGAVVIAEDEEEARNTHPSDYVEEPKWADCSGTWVPWHMRHLVRVELIGTTNLSPGIVLSSFKAG